MLKPFAPPLAVPPEYLPLHAYLRDRYANAVVLTFAEIEDLLGFTLPDLARLHTEWWTTADGPGIGAAPPRAWTLANRTATPNLRARTVRFERLLL